MGGYSWGAGNMSPVHMGDFLRGGGRDSAEEQESNDCNLRAFQSRHRYHIHATMARSGHVADFLVEDADWAFTISSPIPDIGGQAGRFLFHAFIKDILDEQDGEPERSRQRVRTGQPTTLHGVRPAYETTSILLW